MLGSMSELSVDDVRQWARTYAHAWEAADDALILDCFTPHASYRSSPFREPHVGHEAIQPYWQGAAGAQRRQRVVMGEPIVRGDRACIEWWATFVEADGREVTLPGALILTFVADGRCRDLREYWNQGGGRHEPFSGWGR